jgi:Asp-tRNA(Asn)/Glu-tRNA(Gln) amidotransferase B subunit
MGEVMRPLLGRADPAVVRALLAERLAPRPTNVAP